MIVDPSQSGQTATLASTQATRRPKAADASLFSTALASASTKATSSSDHTQNVSTSTKVPKGEKTEAVKGHAYSEVTAGPRNGMFVNTSGNKRDGMAFALVKRDGREFHVYGTGKNRIIVEVKHKDKTPEPTDNTTNQTSGSDDTSSGSGSGSQTTSPATDTTGAPAS